ncbi:MAG: ABC transporter ATP-binding protein [Candidatus Hodarchaeales archaeon]|jgi:ATP-binding cassette subfamily B protein
MATISVKQEIKSPKTFRGWFLGHLLAKPAFPIIVFIGTSATIFIRILIPILLGEALDLAIIDRFNILTNSQQMALLGEYVRTILILGILQFIISVFTSITNEWLSWTSQKRIREEFFDSMQNKPLKFHDSVRTGELMALATNDLGQVGGLISPGFSMMADVFISIILTGILVFTILDAPQLIILSIPFLIAYIWAIYRHNKKIAPISHTFMRKWGAIATAVQDNITGAEVVRAFAEESYERKKFMDYVLDFRDTWYKQQILQAQYFPTLVLFAASGTSVLVGSILILNEQLTIGTLVGFTGVLFTLVAPTYIISFAVTIYNGGLAGAKRIYNMEMKEVGEDIGEEEKTEANNKFQGIVKFKNVSFRYPTSKGPILDDVSFSVAPGQTVAIVGPTGSGKSSLTKLLLRLYDYSGQILIDDVDIQDIPLEVLRKRIGLIEQDIYLFPRSIRENIVFGAREARDSAMIEAAKLAHAHQFITELPKGYETYVGEGGSQLSGGQRQRVALARTFLTDPRILILDDSTSSVDSKTEEEIVKAINAVSQGRTTFIITHRLSQIRRADCVIVIKGSKIIAKGHHSKLIRRSPDYRRIFGKYAILPPLDEDINTDKGGCE